ncbi:MAG: DNA/RNA helicase domain-containing protein [Acidobacteriaceae bacterium]
MSSFYRTRVEQFLAQTKEEILSQLAISYAKRGYTSQYSDQTLTWERDIALLQQSLDQCVRVSESAKSWGVLLEFSIPRKELRIDVVLLIGDVVVVLEAKTANPTLQAKRQVEEYALLLHYFHKASSDRRIVPIVISSEPAYIDLTVLNQRGLFPQLSTYWIAPVLRSSWQELPNILISVASAHAEQISVLEWDESPYFPVPSITEAALALKSGLSIREIAHSEASEHEIEAVGNAVQNTVDEARAHRHHAICFLTGVPGSGKTLVGLSLAHSDENKASAIHFMSGNGPLVKVLQHLFTQESMRGGAPAPQARTEAKTLIENVHVFARYHTGDNLGPPSNHAIIFDEAQRAWNRAQNLKKFKRDYSEPEMLRRIMERHSDWAVIVALVGGGQEINDGEAGLEEWGRALSASAKDWIVHASPEVLEGGASTAGHRLFGDSTREREIQTNSILHLRTSNRSLRAEKLATWVNYVLDGDAPKAASLRIAERFPIFLSRDLNEMRSKLREQGIGANRYGLAGSSGAARLRVEGLEPSSSFHAEYPWEHWYLAERTDVRSSYCCEVFATEFEIQGLELDWIGLCWGGDFIWDESRGWQMRSLRHAMQSKWIGIKNPEKQVYRRNAYRVLLTRARQGMIIFLPKGNRNDPTNLPEEFDATAHYLLQCGVTPFG